MSQPRLAVLAIGGNALRPYQALSCVVNTSVWPARFTRSIVLLPALAPAHVPMPTVVAADCDSGEIVVAPTGVALVGLFARSAA